ncbi:MAG: FAD-binding protein, partial [Anaerolineales bacterium]|nr:FAD-binding protein [Anaerolineales bacterium]
QLGLPVFEIPILPPSVPGMRLHKILVAAIENNGGRVYTGMEAIHAESDDRRVIVVWTKAAAREKAHKAKATILATGGILGGGIKTTYNGYAQEPVFNLPVSAPHNRSAWFSPNFLTPGGHPIFRSGIVVDNKFRPIIENGQVEFENLYIAGSLLNNCEPIHERSLEGVAIGTGYAIGQQLS